MPEHRMLHTTRLRSAAYDATDRALEIRFHDGSLKTWRNVPAEVARRFFASPNPAAFWEDRIAEEYPVSAARDTAAGDAAAKLNDLFGAPPAPDRD